MRVQSSCTSCIKLHVRHNCVGVFSNKMLWIRPLEIKVILFGIYDIQFFHTLTNYVILEWKHHLYLCKLNENSSSAGFLVQTNKNIGL